MKETNGYIIDEEGNIKVEEGYFKKYIITVIGPDGKITNVEKDSNEDRHYQPFSRLNNKMKREFETITEWNTSFDLPNVVAKKGFINIYPYCVYEDEESVYANDEFIMIAFPFSITKKQLQSFKAFYCELDKALKIWFFKKPNIRDRDLDFDEVEMEKKELKPFVEELESKMKIENYRDEKVQ